MADKDATRTTCTAPELLLKVVLIGTLSHYETRGMIDDNRLEHMLHAGKQILYKSHQESDVRLVFPLLWGAYAVSFPRETNAASDKTWGSLRMSGRA